tara:strand:- start:1914 stop:2549 length:636 start_codon:yes stop_codon:yes gene_type:complete
MNILSIDATKSCYSLSILKNNDISTYSDTTDKASSETILNQINIIASKNNINPYDINSVIYNNGPGSFTGVRVSSAIVQAIGFSNDCPVYGINSLMLDAFSIYKEHKINKVEVVRKAFGNQVFHGLFQLNDDSCKLDSEILTSALVDIEFNNNYELFTDLLDLGNEANIKYIPLENYVGSELLIEFYRKYSKKKNNFDYKDALPSYAGHTI